MSHWTRRVMLIAAIAAMAGPASAQTKLNWAHVYEVAEPYHTEALWAADEIKKRAVSVGMKTLRMSGLQKIKDGLTTIEEVVDTTFSD